MTPSQQYFESIVDSGGVPEMEIRLTRLRRFLDWRPVNRWMSWFAASIRMNYDVFLGYHDHCGFLDIYSV